MSKVNSITFRMYNTGSVGDCLLILFKTGKSINFRMLIDCGGWNADTETILACVRDIHAVSGGVIDLLVVTHQHEDHVSGFNQARSEFDKFTIKKLWMSWIEKEDDPIAQILKEKYGKKLKELKAIAEVARTQLRAYAKKSYSVKGFGKKLQAKADLMEDTIRLIEFEQGVTHAKGLAAGKRTNDDAMTYVREKSDDVDYRKPGEVVTIPGLEGVRFFILGPPRDADHRFFKIDMDDDEMYKLALAASSDIGAERDEHSAIFTPGISLRDNHSPFSSQYKLLGKEFEDAENEYNSADLKWRQIETDWLETAASIALKATRLTNNTSLAMAIEIQGKNKVILLPGDAQSGNWMGWHKPEVMQDLKSKGGKDTVDLLRDTVLYKVGHHGSHNGTASKSGLDLMDNKDLVAMMPLVQSKVPKEWGGAKNFPASALYEELIRRTKGRILRTDEGVVADPRAKKLREQLSVEERNHFKKAAVSSGLFVEYTLKV